MSVAAHETQQADGAMACDTRAQRSNAMVGETNRAIIRCGHTWEMLSTARFAAPAEVTQIAG